MTARVRVLTGRYFDSVALMAVSQRLRALPGVERAAVVMGTPLNLEQLASFVDDLPAAGAADVVVAVAASDGAAADAALAEAERGLVSPVASGSRREAPRSVAAALRSGFAADLAVVSVPGEYAAREARLALEQGLDVMLFSNNVAVADEVALKRLALERGRLLMGPDCGTAILDGVGLGFANAVRRGRIGIVAASGTGAQELSCLIDRLGAGVSQLIGVGGRDLSDAVGGLMTLEAIRRLQADPETERIVVVSKPPGHSVAERVAAALEVPGGKPYVLCLLDRFSLDEAAVQATGCALAFELPALPRAEGHALGLFSGGTLCSQARLILGGRAELIDLGEDRYTRGRPHPMIDPSSRVELLFSRNVGLFLLDVVLGYGAHPDPAGALAPAIRSAVGGGAVVVASVTGTEADPQGYSRQVATLREAGAVVAPTARLAALAAKEALA
ncbi:MAG TPA: FdrA family protein [Symbiobacteriaceae bacterium]|nr:FdrA family protein [Symbiobacteriaceae bacterium]